MSITIERSKFMQCIPIYDSPRFRAERVGDDEDSCSSSSIGRNSVSDTSDGGGGDDDDESGEESEVQSAFKGPLDTMNALQEVLPLKRGISNFYSGKSKSFTSLADASSATSIKDLEKVENPYTRKRKNLLAHNFLDKNHNYPLKNNGGGISKRPANSSRSTTAVEDSNSVSTSPSLCLPPLHPHGKTPPSSSSSPSPPRRNSPWRSFSLSDLQCVAAATPNISSLAICSRDEEDKLH